MDDCASNVGGRLEAQLVEDDHHLAAGGRSGRRLKVARDHEPLVPAREMRLRSGDQILIVVPRALRGQVERRLRAVSRAGRLAGWYGEKGDPDPDVVQTDLEVLRARFRRTRTDPAD